MTLRLPFAPIVMAITILACARESLDVRDIRLADGLTIAQATSNDSLTAVLIYDADACLYCATALPEWEELEKQRHLRIVLLLAGDVSTDDQRILQIRRVSVAGTIPWASDVVVPSEYLFRDGTLIGEAHGIPEIRTAKLWRLLESTVDSTTAADSSSGVIR